MKAEQKKKTEQKDRINIFLMGPSGAGKTSLILRQQGHVFSEEIEKTITTDWYSHVVLLGEKTIELCIYDTPGDDQFIEGSFITPAHMIYYVIDAREKLSEQELLATFARYQQHMPKGVKVLWVANKIDLLNDEETMDICVKLSNVIKILRKENGSTKNKDTINYEGWRIVSAFQKVGVTELFEDSKIKSSNQSVKRKCALLNRATSARQSLDHTRGHWSKSKKSGLPIDLQQAAEHLIAVLEGEITELNQAIRDAKDINKVAPKIEAKIQGLNELLDNTYQILTNVESYSNSQLSLRQTTSPQSEQNVSPQVTKESIYDDIKAYHKKTLKLSTSQKVIIAACAFIGIALGVLGGAAAGFGVGAIAGGTAGALIGASAGAALVGAGSFSLGLFGSRLAALAWNKTSSIKREAHEFAEAAQKSVEELAPKPSM